MLSEHSVANSKDSIQETCSQFCDLAMILSRFQNQLQAIREAMTIRQDFQPQILFSHISMGQKEITKSHMTFLMEQNSRFIREEQVKVLFSLYGYKDKLTYSDFLNYVYPYDTDTIKTISTVLSKKYIKMENPKVQQEILAMFIILIEKEIEFMHQFQQCKAELFPHATRDLIKKLMKQIKKMAPHNIHGLQSDYVLTFQQLKNVMRKQKNINERKSQPICRRLSLQKHSFIGADQLEIWLRPWPRIKSDYINSSVKRTLFEEVQQCSKPKVSELTFEI